MIENVVMFTQLKLYFNKKYAHPLKTTRALIRGMRTSRLRISGFIDKK